MRARFLIILLASLLGACSTVQPPAASAPSAAASSPAPAPQAVASAPAAVASAPADDASAPQLAVAPGADMSQLEPPPFETKAEPIVSADLWDRIRAGFQMPDLTGPLVDTSVQWYATRPDYVQRMTDRSSRYLFHIVEEIERRHMPTELALLPFIESAFNPQAQSSAKAAGMWQFIPSTGKLYKLKQNVFRDDRRNVTASTDAALDYLQKLHDMFGDWHLALAAYNWGEGSVQRAIKRNAAMGLPTDYASLKMPAETRFYVPKLQAIKNIVADPARYGLTLPDVPNHPYFETVRITRDIDVALVAKLADVSMADFQALNPGFKKPTILGATNPDILLPYENAELFNRNYERHKGALASWTAVVLARSEKPASVAKRYGISESQLRAINGIPPRMIIRAGSTLVVPRSTRKEQDVAESVAENAMLAMTPDGPTLRRAVYRVRKGDTLLSIAHRYRTTPAHLKSWNRGLASVRVGQSIAVYVPAKTRHFAKARGKTVHLAQAGKHAKAKHRTHHYRVKARLAKR
ncbi:MAG: transglycosylase SLT domain-containing protein [Betaproteobacteria bacterium]|nr:transglycosylase SLT domain-containing protein [Betaproteobacteria bacterium]